MCQLYPIVFTLLPACPVAARDDELSESRRPRFFRSMRLANRRVGRAGIATASPRGKTKGEDRLSSFRRERRSEI